MARSCVKNKRRATAKGGILRERVNHCMMTVSSHLSLGFMRKLLLTSSGMSLTQDEILKLLPKPPKELKLANIVTAANVRTDRKYLIKQNLLLQQAGFQIKEVDIAGMRPEDVHRSLEDQDIIYVQGGNTFYLLKCARESGFISLVPKMLDQGKIYIGISAGAYIACPTIETATWKDRHVNRFGLTDLTAMNLVPFLLSVHYETKWDDILRERVPAASHPVKILTDRQFILVEGARTTLLGAGAEIRV